MTYTYYKIPGQARAVLDIADADPEKIEPLIVINKGLVSSISVDKAQIAGMVVSRVIFNLVSEADIAVTASPDRKLLTATFGGTAAEKATPPPVSADVKQAQASGSEPTAETVKTEQKQLNVESKPVEQPQASTPDAKEADPLGLDEPPAAPASAASPSTKEIQAAAAGLPAPAPAAIQKKLEPVVPAPVRPAELSIEKIVTGETFIEIQTNGNIAKYKILKLTQPERIAIDIPDAKCSVKTRSELINKFGITKARIGINPGRVRIVLDTDKAAFPKHTVTNSPNALRINFN
jgi:type IV pilus assembly protein PilQ